MNRLAILLLVHLSVIVAAEDATRQVRDMGKAGRTADAAAMEHLSQGLDARDARVRAAAIIGLSQAWPAGAQHLDTVRRSLTDFDPEVRRAALGYAGQIGDDSAIPSAIRCLSDYDAATAQAAHLALAALARTDKGTDARAWEAWAEERERVAQPIVERARSAADRRDVQAVGEAIQALLFMRDRPAMVGRILLDLANSPDPAVAQLGLGALGAVSKPEIIAALARDPGLAERVAAAPQPLAAGARVAAQVVKSPAAKLAEVASGPSGIFIFVILAILTAATIYAWPKRKPAPVAAAAPPAKKSKITFTH